MSSISNQPQNYRNTQGSVVPVAYTNQYDAYNRGTVSSNLSYPSGAPPVGVVHDPKYPIPAENDPTLRRSRFRETTVDSRYDQYQRRLPQYKYNLFSLIDEPWNRCCEVGKIGTCPGNQCIARRSPKLDWL